MTVSPDFGHRALKVSTTTLLVKERNSQRPSVTIAAHHVRVLVLLCRVEVEEEGEPSRLCLGRRPDCDRSCLLFLQPRW